TNKLVMKRLNRARSEHGLRRSQIDQVIRVNYERAEAKFRAPGTKRGCIGVRNARGALRPHSWTGGEYLQRVAAEFPRRFERVQVAAGNRSMDSDAAAAVHPSRRLRLGLRFRAILVFRVELRVQNLRFFCHARSKIPM